MKIAVFSLFDSKAEVYEQPFYAINAAVACRMMQEALQSDNKYSKFPADYTLFQISEFDDTLGSLVDLTSHVNLGNLLTFMEPK